MSNAIVMHWIDKNTASCTFYWLLFVIHYWCS